MRLISLNLTINRGGNFGVKGDKEVQILGQVKYLMRFCVRKLMVFLGFYLANSEKLEMKNYLKCRHLHFKEYLKINFLKIFYGHYRTKK